MHTSSLHWRFSAVEPIKMSRFNFRFKKIRVNVRSLTNMLVRLLVSPQHAVDLRIGESLDSTLASQFIGNSRPALALDNEGYSCANVPVNTAPRSAKKGQKKRCISSSLADTWHDAAIWLVVCTFKILIKKIA